MKASESSRFFLTGLCVVQFHGTEGPCGKICKVQFPGMSWATWMTWLPINPASRVLCCRMQQELVEKAKPSSWKGVMHLCCCVFLKGAGSIPCPSSGSWAFHSLTALPGVSTASQAQRDGEGLSMEQTVFYHALWCVSSLSSKYSSVLGNLGFWVTPLVSIPEFSDVFLSQFLMVWGLLLPFPCENFFSCFSSLVFNYLLKNKLKKLGL